MNSDFQRKYAGLVVIDNRFSNKKQLGKNAVGKVTKEKKHLGDQ